MIKIGIDVGGTNTDAALLEDTQVRHVVKTPTTADIMNGIRTSLKNILEESNTDTSSVDAVMIGTTHYNNAVVQRRALTPVAAVRVGLPASASLPPFCDWPEDLASIVNAGHYMVRGGNEYDGRPIVDFHSEDMREIATKIRDAGVTSVGISAVFSPLTAECEERAAEILREECPGVAITLSHDLGRLGLLERENVTLLNAALLELATTTTAAFVKALAECGIEAPLYITQNDGSIVHAEYAAKFPIYSFSSGSTNSMRGAAFLSALDHAIVVDVGGTTTDIGCLRQGFPREANNVVSVGGIRTNFRMPDVLSIGLGGGSVVNKSPLSVGPLSVGYELAQQARIFGGKELTATDIAVASGRVTLGKSSFVNDLDQTLVGGAIELCASMIAEAVDRMKPDSSQIPLIAVGGAAFLIPDRIPGISEVVKVPHGSVANAIGAAIAQVSGEVDQIFHNIGREEAIDRAREVAEEKAISAGANPSTIQLVEVEDLPLAYLPGNALRTRVRVVGDIT